jgi:hypothetical protein
MPTPSTYQTNGMPMATGVLAPGLDANGFISNIAYKPRVVAKTAAYTVLASESGTIFTTEGATGAVAFTLPAASTGPWVFEFFNAEDIDMSVVAGTADTMVTFNDVAADSLAYSTSSEKVGGYIKMFSAGGSVVYAIVSGASHRQTVTVAT